MRPGLAFDRKTARSFDADGRMRVKNCILSTAEVNPYNGNEIPGYAELGLDPSRVYQLYRDPEELSKAVESFEGCPLMLKHVPQTAQEPQKEYQAGAAHSIRFDGKHLRGDLLVSDGYAIELIQSGTLADLSCGYRYAPDMTAGAVGGSGKRYDGRMRAIKGNHVALVDDGRATNAHVADAAFQPQSPDPALQGATTMPMSEHEERRVAQHAPGANPAAAPGAAPNAAAGGTPQGEANEAMNMAAIGQALKHIATMMSAIHSHITGGAGGGAGAEAVDGSEQLNERTEVEGERNAARRAESGFEAGRAEHHEPAAGSGQSSLAKDFDLEPVVAGKEGSFSGASDDGEHAAGGEYNIGRSSTAEGTEFRGNATPHEVLRQDDKSPYGGAMDAQSVRKLISTAVNNERARAQALGEALREVRPILGDLYGMDSAGAVYREALKHVGVNLADVAKGAEKACWQAYKAARGVQAGRPVGQAAMALDAQAVESQQTALLAHIDRISIRG